MNLRTAEHAVSTSTRHVIARRPFRHGRTIALYSTLFVLATLFLLPLVWMVSTALKTTGATEAYPPSLLAVPAIWSNFLTAVTAVPILHYMWNSTLYTGFSLVGDVLSASFIAYGFARMRSRYREIMFVFVLATIMIPYQAIMIPQFILFRALGWVNTYLPLIVPTFFGSPFLIFLMRQFYRSIPMEIDEAAKLDGASHIRIWWQIIVPLSKPALAAVTVFSFMYHWNDYLGPLIYIDSSSRFPVSLGLAQYTSAYGGTEWNLLMAASLVAVVPVLAVFFVAQRYIMQGIVVTGTR